jgi:D-glycero-D-manno-heptose 1,7-bisphosphate phosphatase
VLNVNHGYVYKKEDFDWIDGAKNVIKYLNDKNTLVFVFTNQSGVARGFYREQDVNALHQWMQHQLAKIGAHIDQFAYCPHHPDALHQIYQQDCLCRKPAPGMLLSLLKAWPVDLSKSFVVGDNLSDLQAGDAVGLPGMLFTSGRLDEQVIAFEQKILS